MLRAAGNQSRAAVLLGEGSLLIHCAEVCQTNGMAVRAVFSSDPAVRSWAMGHSIIVHDPCDTSAMDHALTNQPINYLIKIAHRGALPTSLMSQTGMMTIVACDAPHPLSETDPPQAPSRAIRAGATRHGVCWHTEPSVSPSSSTDPILLARSVFDISKDDTAFTLNGKCFDELVRLFEELLPSLANGKQMEARADDEPAADTCGSNTIRSPLLSFDTSGEHVCAQVRSLDFGSSFNPIGWPTIEVNGVVIKVGCAELLDSTSSHEPGTIVSSTDEEIEVATTTGVARLSDVRSADGRRLASLQSALDGPQRADPPSISVAADRQARIESLYERTQEHQAYWSQRLAALQPIHHPYAHRTTGVMGDGCTSEHESLDVSLSLPTGTPANESAHRIIAGLMVYLARINDVDELDIGWSDSVLRTQLDSLEQYAATTVPLRITIDSKSTFSAACESISNAMACCEQHFTFNLDLAVRLVESGQATAGLGPNGTLPVIVQSIDEGRVDARLEADVPLVLRVDRSRCTVCVKYLPSLIHADDACRIREQVSIFLNSALSDPEQHVTDLPLLCDEERTQILIDFNQTAHDLPYERCLHAFVEDQVERSPDRVAVEFEGETLTYRELNERSNRLAHSLIEAGVVPDMIVGICVERSLEQPIALLGVLKAGGAYVPLDPTYPPERLRYMLEDAHVPIVVAQARHAGQLPSELERILIDDEWTARVARDSTENPVTSVHAGNLCYVIHTSGSTGRPKATGTDHRAISNNLLWMQHYWPLDESDRLLHKTSFSFDVSLKELIWPLMAGARLVIARPDGHRDPTYLVQKMTESGITVTHFVPTMLHFILNEPGIELCTSLRIVMCGAEALSHELRRRFNEMLDAQLLHLYGPTEAAIAVTGWVLTPDDPEGRVPLGPAMSNVRIHVLDSHLSPVPIGVPGELHIGGVALARGYLNRPEETASKFIPDPFSDDPEQRLYKTGDLARYLPDGNLLFVGRKDHQVKVRGFRIELGEIESILGQHPSVKQAAVVARQVGPADARLIGYVLPTDAGAPTIMDLRDHLSKSLPEFMIPSRFCMLGAFPLTPSGKIDRNALPDPDHRRDDALNAFAEPTSTLETMLASVMAGILGLDRVSIDDGFFDLGGNSLLAAKYFARIEKVLRHRVPLATLYRAPTVRQLATVIEKIQEGTAPSWSPLVPLKAGDDGTPLICIHPAGGNLLFFREFVTHLSARQTVYGLQAQGLDGRTPCLRSVEEMAELYLREVRRMQPNGPYFFVGASFGGVVGFDMCHRLSAMGEQVGMLAMIDTYGPGYEISMSYMVKESVRHLIGRVLQKAGLGRRTPAATPGAHADRSARSGQPRRKQRRQLLPFYFRKVNMANRKANQLYRHTRWEGNIDLYTAAERPPGLSFPDDLGWTDLVGGTLRIQQICGDHLGIASGPGARLIATAVQARMNAALGRNGESGQSSSA
ncbi:MAG: amino acid adenylation domain-containing protein [Planctomycetes bacterium]|nr:amino acid adenylation domain-containing protein [Planctomycetota bacterium]NOG53472.1 amino acid adenylation domain-containing protein [Planctomycetota bacterium]